MIPDFSLIETMHFEPESGIIRRNLHSARLRNSAKVLGFQGAEQALAALDEATNAARSALRLRLELFANGRHDIASAPFVPAPEGIAWRIGIAHDASGQCQECMFPASLVTGVYGGAFLLGSTVVGTALGGLIGREQWGPRMTIEVRRGGRGAG